MRVGPDVRLPLHVQYITLHESRLVYANHNARCAQYMGALKSFESSLRTRLLFPKFVMGFCSDRY